MSAIVSYNRKNFFTTQTDSEGNVSTDPVSFEVREVFEFFKTRQVKLRRISASEEASPELISYQEYDTHAYWWVICYLNKIQDPINELEAGTQLAIPRLADIEEFRQANLSGQTRGETVILR